MISIIQQAGSLLLIHPCDRVWNLVNSYTNYQSFLARHCTLLHAPAGSLSLHDMACFLHVTACHCMLWVLPLLYAILMILCSTEYWRQMWPVSQKKILNTASTWDNGSGWYNVIFFYSQVHHCFLIETIETYISLLFPGGPQKGKCRFIVELQVEVPVTLILKYCAYYTTTLLLIY